jgi:ligand-binding SRPBCC domain-containing protein
VPLLEASVRLASPPEVVFPFFADAFNLEELTPPWLHFEVVTPQPIAMAKGTRIDYRLRVRGLPLRWTSAITEWDPGRSFVDEQVRGPYRLWRHRHVFRPDGGGTLAEDRVEYEVLGGALVDRLLVRPDLERIFRFRREALERRFGAP